MKPGVIVIWAIAACAGVAVAQPRAEGPGGRTTLGVNSHRLQAFGLRVYTSPESAGAGILSDSVSIVTQGETTADYAELPSTRAATVAIRHCGSLVFETAHAQVRARAWTIDVPLTGDGAVAVRAQIGGESVRLLEARDVQVTFDAEGSRLFLESGELLVSAALAMRLRQRKLADVSIGGLRVRTPVDAAWAHLLAAPSHGGVAATQAAIGPDVIVGNLYQVQSYGSVDGVSAFSMGTISCNAGDEPLLWVASTNQHPVIAQNMYRLKDDRFEHIGQSWLKHGFLALAGDSCGFGCIDPNTGSRLGVGCSDPYSASLNGSQSELGPKSEVNAHTGAFPYPPLLDPPIDDLLDRRLQVHNGDLDPQRDGGGQYFIEAQYVTPDDAAAGNQDNNASYRPITVSGDADSWTIGLTGTTQQMQPAIRAWRASDAGVVETDVRVPGEGLMILAAKATELGDGFWRYEYALQNLNSDRAGRSFRVPVHADAVVRNVGFHDVGYHSGSPVNGTDWAVTIEADGVLWSTESFDLDPNANALRWGTLFNFRFESDAPPENTSVTIGLFKSGDPDAVAASTVGPSGPPPVCGNGVVEGPEACDPPDGEHCDGTCQWICGDGVVQSGESCDPPDGVNCDENCQWICGDGIVQAGEACDGGGETATCDADCTLAICGDGTLNELAGETCDDGGASAACDPDCTPVECGDGLTNQAAGEECDPPDQVTCDADCQAIIVDRCEEAITVCPGTLAGSTVGADSDGEASCGLSTNAADFWFRYIPAASGTAVIETCGSSYDTVLSAHTACPGSTANELACNDDACGLHSRVTIDAVAGTVYLIRVSGFSGAAGDFSLTITGPDCECEADADCPPPDTPCLAAACQQTQCVYLNQDGRPCDDGDACTTEDVCFEGTCTGGAPPGCTSVECTDCNDNGIRDDCEGLADCNANGIPDECEYADCNANGMADVCDIAAGAADCDGGPAGDPDDGATLFGSKCVACHGADGSGGGAPAIRGTDRIALWNKLLPPTTHVGGAHPEYTEQDFADLEAFLSDLAGTARPDLVPDGCQQLSDCDGDGVSDGCELGAQTQIDEDMNGVPDSCDCPPSSLPVADALGPRGRFLTVRAADEQRSQAIRVSFVDLPEAYAVANGRSMWVGPPAEWCENSGQDVPGAGGCSPAPGAPNVFLAAPLQCEPHYTDWTALGDIHVFSEWVIPGGAYDVAVIDELCSTQQVASFSPALRVETSQWADAVEHCADLPCSPPDGIVDVQDVIARLDKFQNRPGALSKSRAEIDPALVNMVINITDVTRTLDAFAGAAYPFPPPALPCP